MSGARLAVRCTDGGRILEVIRDDLGLVPDAAPVVLLPALCTDEGALRCFEMLTQVHAQSAVFGWLIELAAPGGSHTLHFAGVHADGESLFVATENLAEITAFTDELMRVNNEHVNALRRLLKDRADRGGDGGALYERMTELNNANTSLQRGLARQRAELEVVLDAKNELFGMLAHDLRNPLAAAQILTEFLRDEVGHEPQLAAIVDELELCTSMATRLVDGVLDLSAVDAGTLRLDLALCNMAEIVERAIVVERPIADRIGVAIELRDQSDFVIEGDELKLRRLIGNLIDNAVKHSPSGGTVDIAVVLGPDDEVVVSVVDEGDGITDDVKDALFAPYQQGTGATSGVGLGLAIASRIAEGHGGQLVAVNDPERGARFELHLPMRQGAGDRPDQPDPV